MDNLQKVDTVTDVSDHNSSGEIDEKVHLRQKVKIFLNNYWRGITCILTPILLLPIVLGDNVASWNWCAYTLLLMAIFWMTECLPMPVTSFLPIIIFPLTGIMSTEKTCQAYINETVMAFLANIMSALAVEQSGLHLRIVYKTTKIIGLCRTKQLFTISYFTMIMTVWMPSSGITSMMVPVTFALLKIYERQEVGSIFVVSTDGTYASKLTVCFFCAITYSASIGEVGIFIDVPFHLVNKHVSDNNVSMTQDYKDTTFVRYVLFSIPYMLVVQTTMCITLMVTHMGLFRPNSDDAKLARTPEYLRNATKAYVIEKLKKMGKISYHEIMVIIFYIILSILAILPIVYESSFIKGSSWCMLTNFIMFIWPSSCLLCKGFTRRRGQLPNETLVSILDWHALNKAMPYNLMLLMGAVFSIIEAAKAENTNLNGIVSEYMKSIKTLPISVTLFLIIVSTNLVANLTYKVDACNLFTPIAMEMAIAHRVNPIWYGIAAVFSSSCCFLLPVGTPANLIVQFAAKIRTKDMMYCGLGMTVFAIIITWIFMYLLAPLIFSDMRHVPPWINISSI